MEQFISRLETYFPIPIQMAQKAWARHSLSPPVLAQQKSLHLKLQVLAERAREAHPDAPVTEVRLTLLCLLNSIFRYVSRQYMAKRQCRISMESLATSCGKQSAPLLPQVFRTFVSCYPPESVLKGSSPDEFLTSSSGSENRRSSMIEMFVLEVQGSNRAAQPCNTYFSDADFVSLCPFTAAIQQVDALLAQAPADGFWDGSLLKILRAPIEACPESLEDQLAYIQRHWHHILPRDFLDQIGKAFVLFEEERQKRAGVQGHAALPFALSHLEPNDYEAFSQDADWMPRVVLLAKSTMVWMHQLSSKYRRCIERLDQIPDEELDTLASWGITGLWLIGIWERSESSRTIKQLTGNPEAAPSAYSLHDYTVAHNLGGEPAFQQLKNRCQTRGIVLAGDVVPNHTGLSSQWVKEHPDWFIQLDHAPFATYRFTGPDLCSDPDYSIQIEDGYYDHSDAAVVFKHQDNLSGQVRYIYHGNDGTHMPWNDTAQLNYLLPQVREAMIRKIIQLAKHFRILRFDAAMTLTKKHYQRLWFPHPGGGAGVPSRARYSMNPQDFEDAFPEEFWRQVVDRIAEEAPGTLLIAEAFWLMESYFVRTLGMHRVYNSAFMHMLKQEENAKYRRMIKDVLAYNPQILKRFVNFMNNPDEATAVEQFGKGDKYFGVAVLLATLPGLPLFGHGQIEGFREKYGMEYCRPYWEEDCDHGFVEHHERQIFPLLRKRSLFSDVQDFHFFEFLSAGVVNEDVFAFTNRCGQEQAMVIFHNRAADTGGWVYRSVPQKTTESSPLSTTTLAETLSMGLPQQDYWRFRDLRTGMEYLRSCKEIGEEGLYLHLGPYHYHVFLDFQPIQDSDDSWRQLYDHLKGAGAPNLDEAREQLRLAPLRNAFHRIAAVALQGKSDVPPPSLLESSVTGFCEALIHLTNSHHRLESWRCGFLKQLETLHGLRSQRGLPQTGMKAAFWANQQWEIHKKLIAPIFIPLLLLRSLRQASSDEIRETLVRLPFDHILQQEIRYAEDADAETAPLLFKALLYAPEQAPAPFSTQELKSFMSKPDVADFLQIHQWRKQQWMNKERFDALICGLLWTQACPIPPDSSSEAPHPEKELANLYPHARKCLEKAEQAGYRLDKFFDFV